MLDRVSKSESDTADVYRRIEDQLRGMARRLDSSERSQTESNRVMSKAAVEMNIASREQAQAFDQLGAHVANISERLDRVEGREPGEGLRDAVKALHQGLSRLADQISQTANQSATQISALANNLETVAGRVGQARHDSLVATQALEGRLAGIDERVRTLETAMQSNADTIDRALEAIETQKRPTSMEAVVRLEDSVRRLEQRSIDPGIDRRLSGIEKTLSDVVAHIDPHDEPDSIEDNLRKIVQRLESLETAQREAAAEIRKAAVAKPVEEPPPPPVSIASPPPLPPGVTAAFSPMPAFEPPPFADAPPPFAAAFGSPPPFANPLPAFEAPAEAPFTPPPGVAAPDAAAPTVESYLAAARRSARMAAQAETERSSTIGGLRWGSSGDDDGKKHTRPLLVGLAALVGIAVIAGAVLSRHAAPSQPSVSLLDKRVLPAKAPAVASTTPLHPATETTPPPAVIKPALAAKPATVTRPRPSGLMPSGVAPAPAAPTQLAAVQPPPIVLRPPSTAPLDRLTTAANAGNPRAQLIVGLKYLDGDGIPANDGEAAKWLVRAADAGEPVAQYRLGTLYERGRGVPVDAAKAVRWYQAAANQGSRKAMHNLAVAFAEGAGVKKDFTEASRWFLKAANLGLSDSQFNLAVLYERGLGVPQNLVDAYKWYAIAASQGDTESKSRIGAIASQLDTESRAAAQHAADTFRPGQLDARANVAPTMASVTRG
jgi:localization factor PodJL